MGDAFQLRSAFGFELDIRFATKKIWRRSRGSSAVSCDAWRGRTLPCDRLVCTIQDALTLRALRTR